MVLGRDNPPVFWRSAWAGMEKPLASPSWVLCYRINAVMHEQSRYRQARMTRKKNEPLSYAPHSVGDVHSDRTGGIETMLQHLASLRATRKRYRITLRHAAKRLGMSPSELSGIERGELQTTPDEVAYTQESCRFER